MLVVDPIPLYKNGEWRRIPAIDAQSWINAGWSLTEMVERSAENAPDNELKPSDKKVETIDLQPESSDKKVESDNTQSTSSDTKVETAKRKSLN